MNNLFMNSDTLRPKKRTLWTCFNHSAATANRRLRIVLQLLLLMATLQVSAANYFSETHGCGYLMANDAAETRGNELSLYGITDYTMTTAVDCSFLITSAVLLPDGSVQICVQANDQVSTQSWEVWDGFSPPAVATGSLPTMCFTIAPGNGPIFNIVHTVTIEGKEYNCQTPIIIDPGKGCKDDVVTASVVDCNLQTDISIIVGAINTPYVISFGDGSPAEQSSSSVITHTYGQPGTYNVCLTYVAVYNEINTYVTCCYTIQVALPPYCVCPVNVISVVSVEPCTWVAQVEFDLPSGNFPITVDWGDGSAPEIVNGPSVSHDFPDNITYTVCYTFQVVPGSNLTCCEQVFMPQCCLNPNFMLELILPSESCVNPEYRITPNNACQGSPLEVTHLWEFSDGTTFTGPFPPDHLFTNFVDINGQVCVTHTVTCCDESASATVCAAHFPAAYLGELGGELFMNDILPSTNQTVFNFITQNASGNVPLIIEGRLIVNINVDFTGGTWNMARDAEILVSGPPAFLGTRAFTINGTTIRSVVRLAPQFAACCRWAGITSERRTRIRTENSFIMDAQIAIHYPTLTVSSLPFPALFSINTQFINNFYAVKSFRQFVTISRFANNTLNGAPEDPHICGCTAVNAIDFRDVGTATLAVTFDVFSENNQIFNYEKGFNFQNTRLTVRGFNVHHLREYATSPGVPNNAAGQSALGIDFLWTLTPNSRLDLDRISFTDFEENGALSIAVRDRVTRGRHTLRGFAATVGSINTAGIAGGYDLTITSPARLDQSTIHQNTINTDGSNSAGLGFGITGNFTAANNDLRISDNLITVATGGANPLNGGIILTGTEDVFQGFAVEHNTIDLALTNGVGIGVNGARGYCVRRNLMSNFSDATGIALAGGGDAVVECNEVLHKPLAASVMLSDENTYSGNFFSANVNDMRFTGDNRGVTGSLIRWNEFNFSQGPSLMYDANAFTGAQEHNSYNLWTAQNGTGTFEVQHATTNNNGPGVLNSRFHRPSNAIQGSIHFPRRTPTGMMFGAPNSTITSIPSTFCNSTNGCFAMLQAPDPDPQVDYAAMVQNATFWNGMTAAQQATQRQVIYGLLLENPTWLNGSSTLSGFKASQDATFVGQSETLRRAWRQLIADISAHQATLASTYASLDALSNQLKQWFDAIAADPNLEASLQGQIDAAIQQGEALLAQIQQSEDQFAPTVQATVAQLLVQNNALVSTPQYAWNEKRFNQIALNWLAGTEPDATAAADLRSMAQACLSTGGRAVLDARGLCVVWLKEYYTEGSCNGLLPGSTDREPSAETTTNDAALRILPNPADDLVWISLPGSSTANQLVQIFSTDGRQLFNGKLSVDGKLAIPVKGWQGGLYIIKITGDKTTFTRSFVVQHP
jgi:Secretion system C-terminal sorting domain/PKD domain